MRAVIDFREEAAEVLLFNGADWILLEFGAVFKTFPRF